MRSVILTLLVVLSLAGGATAAHAAWAITQDGNAAYDMETLEQARAAVIANCRRGKTECRVIAEGRSGCAGYSEVGRYSHGPGFAAVARSAEAAGAAALLQCQAVKPKGCLLKYTFCDPTRRP